MNGALKVLERVIAPARGGLSTDLAAHLLSLEFPAEDHARYEALSEKAQLGTLSKEEEAELDDYLEANDLLSILKAKARASLKQRTPAA